MPQDIRSALQKHEAVLRLSYSEIVSGINRLLRQGIPTEVICQVVLQAVEAVSKDFHSSAHQEFYERREAEAEAPEE